MGKNTQRIGEILTTPKVILAKPLPSEQRFCDCGAQIEPIEVPILNKKHWPGKCRLCQAKETETDRLRDIRRTRRQNAGVLRAVLDQVIPPKFENAQFRHLDKPLRSRLLRLPRDRGLLMFGPPGVGKSYGMCALARWYILNHYSVIRVLYERLCLDVRQTYSGAGKSELDITKPLMDADVLFIEDIGTTTSIGSPESDFSLRTLLLILDTRLEHCRPTFITSNKSVEQLAKSFDERVASRLHEHCEIVQLKGEDKRKQKRTDRDS